MTSSLISNPIILGLDLISFGISYFIRSQPPFFAFHLFSLLYFPFKLVHFLSVIFSLISAYLMLCFSIFSCLVCCIFPLNWFIFCPISYPVLCARNRKCPARCAVRLPPKRVCFRCG